MVGRRHACRIGVDEEIDEPALDAARRAGRALLHDAGDGRHMDAFDVLGREPRARASAAGATIDWRKRRRRAKSRYCSRDSGSARAASSRIRSGRPAMLIVPSSASARKPSPWRPMCCANVVK